MAKQVIAQPYFTEKTMTLVKDSKYTFIVSKFANACQVSDFIKETYKVKPLDVQILNIKGKKVFFKRRFPGQKSDWKKAIVTISKKEKIKDFEIKS